MTGLVREFLEFFDLDFSIAVFDPESSFVSIVYKNKLLDMPCIYIYINTNI